MTQSLQVNEKEYLPSSELAQKFSYTSDYISKLARDEKILGTRVGRQWFIEPESLNVFIQKLEVEKKIHKENLSRQRKIERHIVKNEKTKTSQTDNGSLLAIGQSITVLVCGLMVGAMSWSVFTNDLNGSDLVQGMKAVSSLVAERTVPASSGLPHFTETLVSKNQPSVATPLFSDQGWMTEKNESVREAGTGPQFETLGDYTSFAAVIAAISVQTNSFPASAEQQPGWQGYFSDEVIITEQSGEFVVQPVFSDSLGKEYTISERFLSPGEEN